jgi:hypothetical protein
MSWHECRGMNVVAWHGMSWHECRAWHERRGMARRGMAWNVVAWHIVVFLFLAFRESAYFASCSRGSQCSELCQVSVQFDWGGDENLNAFAYHI